MGDDLIGPNDDKVAVGDQLSARRSWPVPWSSTMVLLFQVLLPLLAPVVDVAALFSLLTGQHWLVLSTWLGFLGIQLIGATYAFVLDGERLRSLWAYRSNRSSTASSLTSSSSNRWPPPCTECDYGGTSCAAPAYSTLRRPNKIAA